MQEKNFSVYILTNRTKTVLYVGVTSNLQRRITEHRVGLIDGFAKKYHCHILVYFESGYGAFEGIAREKEIKAWRREKKESLVFIVNPSWADLYETIW